MDKGNYNFTDYGGIHTIAGLLKKFFKELPDSLIPAAVHDDFIATAREQDEEQRLTRLKDLVYHLPTAHYHTLKYLIAHLNRVIAHSDQNKVLRTSKPLFSFFFIPKATCRKTEQPYPLSTVHKMIAFDCPVLSLCLL